MLTVNEVISRDPEVLGGTPVFRGTRVPFQALLDYLEGGQTLVEFLDDFPTVTREVRSLPLNRENCFLSTNWDENPLGRVPPPGDSRTGFPVTTATRYRRHCLAAKRTANSSQLQSVRGLRFS